MKTSHQIPARLGRWLAVAAGLAMTSMVGAQTTNWVAYNDHRPTTTPVVNGWRITAPNVTGFDMGAPADLAASPLIDFKTGNPLAATVAFTRTLAPDDFGGVGRPIPTNTPMAQLFYGVCDLSNDGVIGVDKVDGDIVTITFANLNPNKRYVFRGAGARNGSYAARWTVATITASGWIDAHLNGSGPGVITSNDFPANLGAGQAAWNSGGNAQGAVVGWDFIAPAPDGSFSIVQEQYVGPTPQGGQATDASYGYAFGAMLLAEVEVAAPVIAANPAVTTTVEQNRPFSLSVAATGTPLLYQWYKQGVGAIAGATFPTYAVSQAAVSDSGSYYAVVYNPLSRATSAVAQVNVFADTAGPTVESIFSYPTVDAGGAATLDQIIIEFNEPVQPGSVSSPSSYTLSGGGNPLSVIITNNRSVVLVLGSPLATDTDYTVTLSGATDVLNNVAGSSSPSFHSWVTGGGNGLLFEAFNVDGTSVEVYSLTASPNFPNNAFARATLGIFDSRAAFPDDSHNQYGGRISGVFIPPVSGNWSFYFRTRQRGVVYLNPNGTDVAGKVEILRESTGNTPLNWDRFTSPPQSLRAGRAYYIETLYKEGDSGADFIKVAARLQGSGVPTPVDTPDIEVDASSIAGAAIAYPLAPRNLGGTLSIAQDVANLTADENNPTTFSLQVNNPSGLPLQYQWFRDGSPISGANLPTYTIQPTIAADNGATFSVQVAKVGSSVTSRSATLTVVPDVAGPQVLEAFSTNLTQVVVRFNELVEPSSAAEGFSYNIRPENGGVAGVLQPDGKTVIVEMQFALVAGETYEIELSELSDLASNPINPNPSVVTFTAGTDQPRLTIVRSGNQVVLSWPAATPDVLEQTDALASPSSSTVWTPIAAAPTVLRGKNSLTVSAGTGTKVYRLRR
jgi:hypothetical protein